MKLNKSAIASALLVPAVFMGLSACGSSKPKNNKVKGTFPICQTTKVLNGVRVDRSVKTPCVIKDSSGYGVTSTAKPSKNPSPTLTVKPTSSTKTTTPARPASKR
jgi:hypothetical protein